MPWRIAETLLGAQSDMLRVHRRVVRVGAVTGWSAAALFLTAGFVSGNQDLFIEAVGPILAAGFMTTQIVLRREHGGLALIGSAVVVFVMYGVVGNENTLIPAALALVVICAMGMLFIARVAIPVMAGIGAFLTAVPAMWGLTFPEALLLGAVMSLSFVMTSLIFGTMRNAATELNVKLKLLFEQSPTAAFEEDWSEALAYLRSEYGGRPERIREFLLAFPAVVRKAVGLARVKRVNQAAVDLLEASGPGDILGARNPDIVTEENLEAFADTVAAIYQGQKLFQSEFLFHTLEGRPIWLLARFVDNSVGANPDTVLIGMADITHVRAEEEAMEQIIRSKDEFLASISHELRTPLTAVVGLTAELSSSEMTPGERQELMTLVAGQAEEMSHIIEDLLVASRAEIGTVLIEPCEVTVAAEIQAAVEGMGLSTEVSCRGECRALADPARLRQILRNLLTNVERYGGPHSRILCGHRDQSVWVEVRDDGSGVAPEVAESIFEPYATAHPAVTGSVGLGLSVARQLAELMGGSLRYDRDGGETVFRLQLPATRAPVAV